MLPWPQRVDQVPQASLLLETDSRLIQTHKAGGQGFLERSLHSEK